MWGRSVGGVDCERRAMHLGSSREQARSAMGDPRTSWTSSTRKRTDDRERSGGAKMNGGKWTIFVVPVLLFNCACHSDNGEPYTISAFVDTCIGGVGEQ